MGNILNPALSIFHLPLPLQTFFYALEHKRIIVNSTDVLSLSDCMQLDVALQKTKPFKPTQSNAHVILRYDVTDNGLIENYASQI